MERQNLQEDALANRTAGADGAVAPPVAARRPVSYRNHGDLRTDDYAWLREKENPEVIRHLEAENVYTEAVLGPSRDFEEALYREMLSRIQQTDLTVPYRLRGYLYDTYTANREGVHSTGSAARAGYRSLPSVSSSNLLVASGELSEAELLQAAGEGVYVTDVAGLHSGVNPVTGIFSVGASGRTIRGGELAEPIREFTIAGELLAMLGGVREAGAEARWVPFGGSVKTPPLLIGELSISGS